jgi:predicted dehydrogenase
MAYGVPNLINHGCHWYDTALSLAGDSEVAWVSGLVDDFSSEPEGSSRRRDPTGRGQIGLTSGITVYVTPDGGPGLAFEVLGDKGRLLLMNDARDAHLWSMPLAPAAADPAPRGPQGLRLQPLEWPEPETGWPAGPAAVRDLVGAIREGRSTVCDMDEARRATEVGFAIHASSAADGARVALADVDRTLRIESLPWGNE